MTSSLVWIGWFSIVRCKLIGHQWLDLVEFWYNTSLHSALGRSPFEVPYGYAPTHFGISPTDDQPVTDIASWLQDHELMSEVIRQHLLRAKQRMKRYADGRHSERQF